MMKTLKSIFAFAIAVIVGRAGTEHHAAIEPRNQRPRLLSSAEITRVLVRACGNCHSNHTDWPWYSHVRRSPGGSHRTSAKAGRSWISPSGKHIRRGKSVTNWKPCADSYRRAGCHRASTLRFIQRQNSPKRIRKQSVLGRRSTRTAAR